jgi:choline dehydrogenase-like flavoprotein
MLASDWRNRKRSYDFVVVGSGYGGAVVAARVAHAEITPPPSVCVLERGREWPVGTFPDTFAEVTAHQRGPLNPLGLYETVHFRDLSVLKGNGLGGGSLINANIALEAPDEAFATAWPPGLTRETLAPYYDRARRVLSAGPDPHAAERPKFQALARAARAVGGHAVPTDLAVNFTVDGPNEYGVPQQPCVGCGDCMTGCNFAAKNTLPMNYLPLARRGGAEIFTGAEVEWVEKLAGGGWRVHGTRTGQHLGRETFTVDARHVMLAAGALNTTEILLRSESRGLSVSPRLGTSFSGNGDFFAVAYNADEPVGALGIGRRAASDGRADTTGARSVSVPGPVLVGSIAGNGYLVQDGLIPSAYVRAAQVAFATFRGEDTDAGDERVERERVRHDLLFGDPYDGRGALSHTLLLLTTSTDDASGSIVFEAPWHQPTGRISVIWDDVGRQTQFARLNAELRRMARGLGASFVESAFWTAFDLRRLVTLHPLGGCPVGEDYMAGAADEFGRVFAGDGTVHEGLFVTDGALVPAALGANPFLTIAAMAERIAERTIRHLQGDEYPAPKTTVGFDAMDPRDLVGARDAVIERTFRRAPHLGIEGLVNRGGFAVDIPGRRILNDANWKGFLPKGLPLGELAARLFSGYYKRFWKEGDRYLGETRYLDGRVPLNHTLEEIVIEKRQGDLDPGSYVLLRYSDPVFDMLYYDIMKLATDELLLYRGYTGVYPHGVRGWTAPLLRGYGFGQMSALDHERLYAAGSAPTAETLEGTWRMDAIANANHLPTVAYLRFDRKPDGRLESRYQLLGLIEGLVMPNFLSSHFQLHDFTPFHDEIRMLDRDCLVGRWITGLPSSVADVVASGSLGLIHVTEADGQKRFGFHYLLTRVTDGDMPANRLLQPFLDAQVPAGVGLSFEEEMDGSYLPGLLLGGSDAASARPLRERAPREGGVPCRVRLQIAIGDLTTFLQDEHHEARCAGTITFSEWDGAPQTFAVDPVASRFSYLQVARHSGEAEMVYHLEFFTPAGRRYLVDGRKHMQKDAGAGARGVAEVLEDYTTLVARLFEMRGASDGTGEDTGASLPPSPVEIGAAHLRFRTFENLAALGSLTEFLTSFRVTGTTDPAIKTRARLAFAAFTAQFLKTEYDPLAPGVGTLPQDVRDSVALGAATPDFFSTRPSNELQAVLRDARTAPLTALLNSGDVRIDFAQRRIHRDSFWKGSFAEDTLLGWEERIRTAALGGSAERLGALFAGGAFWKRFDAIRDGVATGHVVNYELHQLPGKPEVREVQYPNDDRRYFRRGDPILLLEYVNHPYRTVYDTIKVVDDLNAIGVMHLGEFPNGLEFATFVMARHNYPFEKMSADDHDLLFAHPDTRTPAPAEIEGAWTATLVFLCQPDISLWNAANPDVGPVSLRSAGDVVEASYGLGGGSAFSQRCGWEQLRRLDDRTLLARWAVPDLAPGLYERLRGFIAGGRAGLEFRLVLTRAGGAL